MHEPMQLAFLGPIGGPELMIILLIVLLIFGPKKLPELAKGLGRSIREFKKATSEVEDDFRSAMDAADPNTPAGDPKKKPASTTADKKMVVPAKESADSSDSESPKSRVS